MRGGSFAGKRVAIYARFSSAMQRDASIDDQVRRCTTAVEARGGTVDSALVFHDRAVSGASLDRAGFTRLMKLVGAGGVDVVVTEDMSRISRDFADGATIFRELQFLGVPLIGVADGIDTSQQGAKLSFTMKSLMSDLYIDDLRDKTLRGLEGRARAGYSTGGLPLGYRSVAQQNEYGGALGYRAEIEEAGAKVVRRIFQLYLEGRSYDAIAHLLNAQKVPPARAKTKHRRKGWVASTIRAMLHNEAYIGKWTFNRLKWVKLPGTNTRRPRPKPDSELIRTAHPDLRIVDDATWNAVHARLVKVRARYVKAPGGSKKGASLPGRQNHYVLSGLLACGLCGAPMTIHAGTSARYYRCSDAKKRGTCSNKLSLREDVAKDRLIRALQERYAAPAAVLYLRKRIAEHLRTLGKRVSDDIEERRARLDRTENRIAGLVSFISNGDQSESVRKALLDLEAQARAEKAAIAGLGQERSKPIHLPTPEDVTDAISGLSLVMEADPLRAREKLRSLFEGERLMLMPQPGGFYIAEGRIDLLAFLYLRFDAAASAGPRTTKARTLSDPSLTSGSGQVWPSHCCAGRI